MGKESCKVTFSHFTTAEEYPDKLAAVLGKSEISFTFNLSDIIMLSQYNTHTGNREGVVKAKAIDIGQERDGAIGLVDEQATILPGFAGGSEGEKDDPRIK